MRIIQPFIRSHIAQIFKQYDQLINQQNIKSRMPFDQQLRSYFLENKTLGPSERSIITESVYKILRNSILFEYLAHSDKIEHKIDILLQENKVEVAMNNPNIPYHIRSSCPKELFELIAQNYGEQNAFEMLINSNEQAPLTIRANPMKTTREQLINIFKSRIQNLSCKFTQYSPYGITFNTSKQINYKDSPEFKQGLFEIQDEASQICALRVQCKPHNKVLDYCAGSGGKTLAFAHQLENTGQIYLHDIRQNMIDKAKKRCARAGVQNTIFSINKKLIKSKFDWILLDVPCTGLGTLRRNPDLKLYFKKQFLNELVEKQKMIFDEAQQLLKNDGKIVYVTCSFLKQENQEQIEYFCKKYGFKVYGEGFFQSLPQKGNMDSFFSATLVKQ